MAENGCRHIGSACAGKEWDPKRDLHETSFQAADCILDCQEIATAGLVHVSMLVCTEIIDIDH